MGVVTVSAIGLKAQCPLLSHSGSVLSGISMVGWSGGNGDLGVRHLVLSGLLLRFWEAGSMATEKLEGVYVWGRGRTKNASPLVLSSLFNRNRQKY